MSDPKTTETAGQLEIEVLTRLVATLIDHLAGDRSSRVQFESRALPLLERIAIALERGAVIGAGSAGHDESAAEDRRVVADARGAIDEKRWDRAQAILDGLATHGSAQPQFDSLRAELHQARSRATTQLTEQIEAARQANDATGALKARDELGELLSGDDLKTLDRSLIEWLMKLIQRRLRARPIGGEVAALATEIANRFAGTPEGASLRAALPTLRRSAGLCPRCSEPYLGVDDACPKCLAQAGQTPAQLPTLTFVTDDLDAVVSDSKPIDVNDAEIWKLP